MRSLCDSPTSYGKFKHVEGVTTSVSVSWRLVALVTGILPRTREPPAGPAEVTRHCGRRRARAVGRVGWGDGVCRASSTTAAGATRLGWLLADATGTQHPLDEVHAEGLRLARGVLQV